MTRVVVCRIDPDKEDPILAAFKAGLKVGREEGVEIGKRIMLVELVEDKKISLDYAARQVDMTEDEFLEMKLNFKSEIN